MIWSKKNTSFIIWFSGPENTGNPVFRTGYSRIKWVYFEFVYP